MDELIFGTVRSVPPTLPPFGDSPTRFNCESTGVSKVFPGKRRLKTFARRNPIFSMDAIWNSILEGVFVSNSLVNSKVGDRFQNIAIISVIPNMVKAGYRG